MAVDESLTKGDGCGGLPTTGRPRYHEYGKFRACETSLRGPTAARRAARRRRLDALEASCHAACHTKNGSKQDAEHVSKHVHDKSESGDGPVKEYKYIVVEVQPQYGEHSAGLL